MSFEIGDRICYPEKEGVNWLGVYISPERKIVRLDSGKIVNLKSDTNLIKVNYWKEVQKPFRNLAAMEKYRTAVKNLIQYKAKKSVEISIPLLVSMWYWLNNHVFDDKLHSIELKIIKSKNPLGLYKTGSIMISSYLPTYAAVFSVMAHEMVHQLNFEYDIPKGVYSREQILPNKGHGSGFMKEAKRVGSELGIKIEDKYDEVEVDGISGIGKHDDLSEAKRTRRYAFLLTQSSDGYVYGFIIKQKSKLGETKQDVSRWTIRHKNMRSSIYGGTSDLELPTKYLNAFGDLTSKKVRSLPKDIVNMLKNSFKPLDIVEGPDKM